MPSGPILMCRPEKVCAAPIPGGALMRTFTGLGGLRFTGSPPCCFSFAASFWAPAEQRIAQQQEKDEIERENITFCERHGMLVGTGKYARCAEDLMDIRAKQDQLTAENMQSTL